MKYLIFLLSFTFAIHTQAQCPDDFVFLESQEDILQFLEDYPNCTNLTYDLYIYGALVNDVSGLSNIQSVGGPFEIYNTSCSEAYFPNLNSVNGSFMIYDNDLMTDANFPILDINGNEIEVSFNQILERVQLCSIQSCSWLSIIENPNLSTLCLDQLTSVASEFVLENSALSDVSTFSNLTTVDGYFHLRNNQSLTNCEGICPLLFNSGIGGNIDISNNPSECSSQSEVESNCESLSDCPPGDVFLTTQAEVDQFLLDHPFCTNLESNLSISSNLIHDIAGLSSIKTIAGNLMISNTNCTTANLWDLNSVNGNININDNSLLEEVKLNSITGAVSSLQVTNNLNLEDLHLCSLDTIYGNLLINTNKNLSSLCLDQLTSVGTSVYLYQTELSNLNTLSNLQTVGTDFSLLDHKYLSNCSGICTLIENNGIGGNIYISDNPSPCNNQAELDNSCTILSDCPPGDVYLYSQSEIDQFLIDYPDCKNFNGGLYLWGNLITDVTGFSTTQSINGDLHLRNTNCSNLTLPNLSSVIGNISISSNLILSEFLLPSLTNKANSLDISLNEMIDNIQLCSLNAIGDEFFVIGSYGNLTSICFDDLISVGGNFILTETELTDVNTLSNLSAVKGFFDLTFNYNLGNCEGICPLLDNNGIGGEISISENNTSCDSQAEVENNCPVVLPIELISFEGSLENSLINLSWITVHEQNNEGFEIQSSQDGIHWTLIDFVEGKGNTIENTLYSYHNIVPLAGTNFFRLKQMDEDGSFSFSNIIAIEYKNVNKGVQVFPNPSKGLLNLQMDLPSEADVKIIITDILGKKIWEMNKVAAQSSWREEFTFDNNGVYFITAFIGNEVFVNQVLILD